MNVNGVLFGCIGDERTACSYGSGESLEEDTIVNPDAPFDDAHIWPIEGIPLSAGSEYGIHALGKIVCAWDVSGRDESFGKTYHRQGTVAPLFIRRIG